MPTEDEFYQVIAAIGNDDVLTCRRIAKAVCELLDGWPVDEVLRDDLQKARRP